MPLTSAQITDRLVADGTAIVKITGEHPPETVVPTCDDWTLGGLADHVLMMWRFVATALETGGPADPSSLPPLEGTKAEQLQTALDALLAQLAGHETTDPTWTIVPHDQTFGVWMRQLSLETMIHRHDAESAAGTPGPLDALTAVDAIDETFNFSVAFRKSEEAKGTGQTIHLHATDTDGEWMIVRGADRLTFTHEHAKGDVAARGAAGDLLLMLWGRISPEALQVFGDVGLLHDWQRDVVFA